VVITKPHQNQYSPRDECRLEILLPCLPRNLSRKSATFDELSAVVAYLSNSQNIPIRHPAVNGVESGEKRWNCLGPTAFPISSIDVCGRGQRV